MSLLDLDNVSIHFGGVQALNGLSLSVQPGEIHGLIGPNGAGKTTAINVVTGLYRPSSGVIRLGGAPFLPRPRDLSKLGIARTFQAPAAFDSLNAIENVMAGGYSWTRAGLVSGTLRFPGATAEERQLRDRASKALDRVGFGFPKLGAVAALPVGARRQLELARALMSNPRLLLLDEPTGGLTQADVEGIGRLLRELRDEAGGRLAVLLVEHNVPFVFGLCDAVTAMDRGATIASGQPAEVRGNQSVISSYLGVGIPSRSDHPLERATGGSVLKVAGVSSGYGSTLVLRDVSLEVREGETVALFGRNGAGKSTLLNTIVGAPRARTGSITWLGSRIETETVEAIIRSGIGLVPQDRAVLERQSVVDNLLISTFGLGLTRRQFQDRLDELFERFPLLARRRTQPGASLSGGERQMLAIAKVLVRRPRLLLLDEPSIGLAPTIVEELHEIVARLSREGLSVLVGEQNVSWIVPIATRAYVIDTGRITAEGVPAELATSESLAERYLGGITARDASSGGGLSSQRPWKA